VTEKDGSTSGCSRAAEEGGENVRKGLARNESGRRIPMIVFIVPMTATLVLQEKLAPSLT
jgi:hypothetical protein